ncbi:MAG: GNAT family N-acetyltransferase [Planctomycetota bacterium]|jgi:RimJ/RimL family protein N-acetyltransferase
MSSVVETGRLRLRVPRPEDDAFFLALLNDPDWLRFVNDPGVRDQAGAREWVESRLLKLQAEHGFTLFLVERREDGEPLGICGLVKRESLDRPDLGFGFLPVGRGRGYAEEAARACMDLAREEHGIEALDAVTDPANAASIRLLERLGFEAAGMARLPGEDVDLRRFTVRLRADAVE